MSLRENVLFGAPYDARLYAQVLTACALDADVRQLELTRTLSLTLPLSLALTLSPKPLP